VAQKLMLHGDVIAKEKGYKYVMREWDDILFAYRGVAQILPCGHEQGECDDE
jgi:hypothetical protein